MLESLDCPDPSVMAPRRTRTITPIQALSLSNNAFMEKCAERFAARIRREAGDDAARAGRARLAAGVRPAAERSRGAASPGRSSRGRASSSSASCCSTRTSSCSSTDGGPGGVRHESRRRRRSRRRAATSCATPPSACPRSRRPTCCCAAGTWRRRRPTRRAARPALRGQGPARHPHLPRRRPEPGRFVRLQARAGEVPRQGHARELRQGRRVLRQGRAAAQVALPVQTTRARAASGSPTCSRAWPRSPTS